MSDLEPTGVHATNRRIFLAISALAVAALLALQRLLGSDGESFQ